MILNRWEVSRKLTLKLAKELKKKNKRVNSSKEKNITRMCRLGLANISIIFEVLQSCAAG